MTKIKFALGAGLLAPLACLAQEASSSLPAEFNTALSNLQGAGEDAVSAVLPVIGGIVVALFGIVAIVFAWNKIKARFGR